MNDIRKELFPSKLSTKIEKVRDKTTYIILPQYGNGTFIIYEIIKGVYLLFNDLEIKNPIMNKNSKFSSPIIKIDYCIYGNYIGRCPGNMMCVANKGNSTYYVGRNNFIEVDFKGKSYKSISIFCYLNETTHSIKELFGISKYKIENYYKKLSREEKVLIVETDIKVMNIIKDIREYIKGDNVELIKLRTMELFLLEINNYEVYKNKKKKYYTKSTIDRVKTVKAFIEDNIQEHITIDRLSKKFNIGVTNLKECFKYVYGMGIYTYLKNYRMKIASKLLENSDYSILEIANMTGYSNQSSFGSVFKKVFGVTPLKYKKSI